MILGQTIFQTGAGCAEIFLLFDFFFFWLGSGEQGLLAHFLQPGVHPANQSSFWKRGKRLDAGSSLLK